MAGSFYDLSDASIAGILIGSGFALGFLFCVGVCSIFYGWDMCKYISNSIKVSQWLASPQKVDKMY